MSNLIKILSSTPCQRVLPEQYHLGQHYIFKLDTPSDFEGIDPLDTPHLIKRTQELLSLNKAILGIGRYAEQRELYQHPQYGNRCVHLGLDLTVPAATAIYSPLPARLHSLANNDIPGDYGPTLILEHRIQQFQFFSLYGHLSIESLTDKHPTMIINAGDKLGEVGASDSNGGWPPHCHIQLITDIGSHQGNFPGVCTVKESPEWLQRCPNPNLLLRLY